MSIYIDDALSIRGTLAEGETVTIEQLIRELGERLNPQSNQTDEGRKRVDETRIELLLLTSHLFEWGTIVFGPDHTLSRRQWAAQNGDTAIAVPA